jgi:DNA-binding transcriptional LysR family regulator
MIPELKTLVAVAREGTFAAAGQQIGLTQAAVSAQMKRLEDALGFDLFERTGRSARLNHRGQQTLAQARELLRLYEQLGSNEPLRGEAVFVSLGAIASVQQTVLPGALAQFHSDLPGSRSRIVPGVSSDLLNAVDAGELDAAVIIRPPFALPSDLRWTALAHEPFRLLVPRALKGRPWRSVLQEQGFIRYDRHSFGGRQVDRFLRARRLSVHELCEVDDLEAIARMVGKGMGVALLPQTADGRRWPAGVHAIDLGAQTFHREIGLVHRTDIPPAAQRLRDLIVQNYRARVDAGAGASRT